MTTIITPAQVTSELLLIGVVATFLTAATVWFFWYVLETIFPDDVRDPEFFLTFIIVFIPFVMLIYFGLDAIVDDAVATRAGRPVELPAAGDPSFGSCLYRPNSVAGDALAQTENRQRVITAMRRGERTSAPPALADYGETKNAIQTGNISSWRVASSG